MDRMLPKVILMLLCFPWNTNGYLYGYCMALDDIWCTNYELSFCPLWILRDMVNTEN